GVRQKFTLAHELGHVIIPWHIGTIVSSHEFDDSLDSEYSRLEAEANLFAAELLMPSRWITEIFEVARPFTDSVSLALRTSGVSRDALLIKLFRVIEHPVLCVQHGDGGNILKRYATSSSPKGFSCDSVEGFDLRIERSQATREVFALGDRHYVSWVFRPLVIGDVDPRSWREVFEEILRETGTLPYKQSANASLAAKYQRLKGKPVEEICAAIFNSFKANDMLIGIASHPLFPQYVIKRVNELRSGKRSKRT
ncbi:MAG: hypothetical protein JWP52_680, partial [Rhizobacter sp.]|nr:hypothetical protein [Rhizobacter sp.]